MRSYSSAVFGCGLSWLIFAGVAAAVDGVTLQGYTGAVSYAQGDTIDFYLSSDKAVSDLRIPIYNVVKREVDQLVANVVPQIPTTAEPWKDGFGFNLTAQYQIPSDLPSGMYFLDTIRFFVKRASRQSDIAILHPTNTTNAYTTSGGKSLYVGTPSKAQTVSFHRPQRDYGVTLPFDRWITNRGFDYRYLTDTDVEDFDELSGSKLLIITGGSEYWTRESRENFDRFVDNGGNVLVIAGNTMNRPVSLDSRENPTQMTETREDPRWKAMWNDTWLNYPTIDSIQGDFYWGGYGFGAPNNNTDLGWDGWKIVDDSVPYLQGTGLRDGDIIPMLTREYDAPPILGFDPTTGEPILDKERLGLHDLRLIAFDRSYSNWREQDGYGAWYEWQRTPTSGRVIVVGSTNWTNSYDPVVRQVTANMIDYLLNWRSTLPGDIDGDHLLTVRDLEAIVAAIQLGAFDSAYDVDQNQTLDDRDRDYWVHEIKNTYYGDANLDGVFDSRDFVGIMQAGEYDDLFDNNSSWATGDFNGDGDFTSRDLVLVMLDGGYDQGVRASGVPEPRGCVAYHMAVLLAGGLRRRRSGT